MINTTRTLTDGTILYFQNGYLHRENAPAVIHRNGTIKYYQNGILHRTDGPAIIWSTGKNEYWENEEKT